jgi:hypothetical protein
MKELMGTLSPAYGMIKGEGLFGNAVGKTSSKKERRKQSLVRKP